MPLPTKLLPQAIETAEDAAKNLAKYLKGSKEKQRMYHATNKDFSSFRPSHRGAYFTSPDRDFANAHIEKNSYGLEHNYNEGANVMPVYVQAENPFDYEKIQHLKNLFRQTKQEGLNLTPEWKRQILEGDWPALENEKVQRAIKNLGHDSFYVTERLEGEPIKNLGVFNPTQIKSAIGNRGTFDPTNPDITKAEGGAINPIKTPQEMLLELANVPRMANGHIVEAGSKAVKYGGEMAKLIQDAINKYIRLYKKNPPPEDIKALEAHVAAITQKPTIWTDPVTQARARHELATKPGLINPEDVRDPFLTQAMTGRGVKGTRQAPFVADINDPNLQKSLETKQMSGRLENLAGAENIPSTTPAADALARMATGLEQQALSSGKVPLIDQLKIDFFKKNKRYPSDEELEVIIAEFNPLRHQYGSAGTSIVTSRPPTAKGMSDWRSRARAEGVPEVYLQKPPTDYPNYLQAELDIAKGVQPTVRQSADDLIKNPNREYAEGHGVAALTPAEMQAMMIEYGYTPGKFKQRTADMLRAGARRAGQVGQSIASSAPARVAGKVARPTMAALGPAFAAMQAHDVGRRLAAGDYLGAANSTISGTLGGLGGMPGMIAALPFEHFNTMRDEERRRYGYGDPDETTEDYVSVMEGYK